MIKATEGNSGQSMQKGGLEAGRLYPVQYWARVGRLCQGRLGEGGFQRDFDHIAKTTFALIGRQCFTGAQVVGNR